MDEKLIAVIEKLGADGITVVFTYLFLEYATLWLFFFLVTWGIRTVWEHVKEDFNR